MWNEQSLDQLLCPFRLSISALGSDSKHVPVLITSLSYRSSVSSQESPTLAAFQLFQALGLFLFTQGTCFPIKRHDDYLQPPRDTTVLPTAIVTQLIKSGRFCRQYRRPLGHLELHCKFSNICAGFIGAQAGHLPVDYLYRYQRYDRGSNRTCPLAIDQPPSGQQASAV